MRFKNGFFLSLIIVLFCLVGVFGVAKAEDNIPTETDFVPPIISLVGEAFLVLNVGDIYIEAGATALDDVDGDITANIIINGAVDTAVAGNYTVNYSVSDAAGNSAVPVIRNVAVNDLVPITIPQETFIIRNGDSVIWQGTVSLPSSATVSINDSNGVSHSINSQSVLAMLYSIDQSSDAFAITNLQYYDSFSSFYLKCILPAGGVELCDNWQYAVGNGTPWQSIDANILSNEQTIGIFFGSQHRLNLETSNVDVNTEFLVKAENYNYVINVWDPLLGVSIGLTLPNPDDPWNPSVISTHLVDASGSTNINISEPNTYNLGIVEDFYFPVYQIIVSVPVASELATLAPVSSGGGGYSYRSAQKSFDLALALDYLKSVQAENGSFGGGKLYSDWVAIAYGAANVTDNSHNSLLVYLKNNIEPNLLLTDNERRAMALLALGKNPYDFEGVNYIASIIKEFDGQQFGDSGLVNDDIFALIPLLGAGYDQNDDIIDKSVLYILSQQDEDGSWNKSVDLSAAAIQALSPLSSYYEPIAGALSRAEQYIVSRQNDDGGFFSVYATAWATQAMTIMNKNWIKNGHTPQDYLAVQQALDGAAVGQSESLASRIWATSYAIPAFLGKDWSSIFKAVAKPIAIEQPIAVELILAEDKVLENNVLGIKEVAEENNTNKPATIIKPQVKQNTSSLASANDKPKDILADDIQPKIINSPLEEQADHKNNFLLPIIIVAIFIGGGILFRFWRK